MGLAAQVHDIGDKAHIDTIQEIANALIPFLVGISDATQVYLPNAALLEPSHRLPYVAIVKSPEMGKVVHQTIRYHSQSHLVTLLLVYLHQAIHGIIERRISANNHYRLIAIVDKHFHQTLYFFPALAATPTASGTIKKSPFVLIHCHDSYFDFLTNSITCSTFCSIGCKASIQ